MDCRSSSPVLQCAACSRNVQGFNWGPVEQWAITRLRDLDIPADHEGYMASVPDRVEQLDRELQNIDEALVAAQLLAAQLAEHCSKVEFARSAVVNLKSPVRRLPDVLLVEVMELVVYSEANNPMNWMFGERPHCIPTGVLSLSQVCASFRHIALRLGKAMWGVFALDFTLILPTHGTYELVRLYLKNAGGAPLHLSVALGSYYDSPTSDGAEDLSLLKGYPLPSRTYPHHQSHNSDWGKAILHELLNHSSSWKSVTLWFSCTAFRVATALLSALATEIKFPRLESFSLLEPLPSDRGLVATFSEFFSNVPQLCTLALPDIDINFHFPISRLVQASFELCHAQVDRGEDLKLFFKQAVSLKHLFLKLLPLHSQMEPPSHPPMGISIPSLASLDIDTPSFIYLSQRFVLRLPSLNCFYLFRTFGSLLDFEPQPLIDFLVLNGADLEHLALNDVLGGFPAHDVRHCLRLVPKLTRMEFSERELDAADYQNDNLYRGMGHVYPSYVLCNALKDIHRVNLFVPALTHLSITVDPTHKRPVSLRDCLHVIYAAAETRVIKCSTHNDVATLCHLHLTFGNPAAHIPPEKYLKLHKLQKLGLDLCVHGSSEFFFWYNFE